MLTGCEDRPGGSNQDGDAAGNLSEKDTTGHKTGRAPDLQPFDFRRLQMGVQVELSVWAESQEKAEKAAKAAFAAIGRVDRLMNHYNPRSELSRLSDHAGQGPMPVSPELMAVLRHAKAMHKKTGGAFDPTAAPLFDLWQTARKAQRKPPAAAIVDALSRVGMQHVKLDESKQTAELTQPGMRLDLGGIAKGYAADLAADAFRAHGVTRFAITAGGDMKLGAPPPDADGWVIDVPNRPPMTLANTAVSISGDTAQFVVIDGWRYSHVVDPRTGQAVTSRQMAVVTAPRGIDCDPLATAGCVMQPPRWHELLVTLNQVEGNVWVAQDE